MLETEIDDVVDRIAKIYNQSSPEEQKILYKILEEISETGESKTYTDLWLQDYKEIPVDLDTFLCSNTYLGNITRQGEAIYPFWRKELHRFFDAGNKYIEWILTGATRIGKSSTGITAASYMLYLLMCLRNPQKFFNKKEGSKFSILFFNITKDLAKGVAYKEFNSTLKESPWFCSHGTFSSSEENPCYIPEGGKIEIDFGSDASHGLGKQVFVAFMDEINFSKAGVKDVNKAKAHMRETYNTLSARVKGTFKYGGEVFGKIFGVSSKRGDSDFMEDYVQEQLDAGAGEHMMISDAPQWEVLPEGTFSSEKFWIAVGDRHRKSFVVPDNQTFPEALEELRKQGYKLYNPPIDMKSDFLANFQVALRDLAGIAVVGSYSFITQDIITQCINPQRRNPFYQDVLQIGVNDNYTIQEFFHLEEVPPELKKVPIFIHLDLALVKDRAGISGGGITSRKDIMIEGKKLSQPFFSHLFTTAIEAPRGDKIAFSKIFEFICWLRKVGFNIERISRDQFQSEYLAQLLEQEGFKVDKISLDRTPDGYLAFRSVLQEKRFDMLDCQLLQDELVHLQSDSVTGKVDHPSGGCFTSDTKIKLTDDRSVTIADLMKEQNYKQNYAYTVNEETGDIEEKPIVKVFFTKITKYLMHVVLSNGKAIYCTEDHPFMKLDKTYDSIKNLPCGQPLMYVDEPVFIRCKSKLGIASDVYDLEIQDNHNFLLDAGCIVHNSKDAADSCAGWIWNAIQVNPGVQIKAKTVANAIKAINSGNRDFSSGIRSEFAKLYKK